jgi:hypothetical protein
MSRKSPRTATRSGGETGVEGAGGEEPAAEEAGGDQEDQGEGDLGDDQRAAEVGKAEAPGAAGALPGALADVGDEVAAGRLAGRHEAEEDRRAQGDGGNEQEHAAVDGQVHAD